jgi:hypothetical protein
LAPARSELCELSICHLSVLPMDMVMVAVLHYAAEASEILAFLIVLPGACAATRKWVRKHRRRGYRPRHARRRRP